VRAVGARHQADLARALAITHRLAGGSTRSPSRRSTSRGGTSGPGATQLAGRWLGQVWDRCPQRFRQGLLPLLPVVELVELSAGYVEQGCGAVKLRVGMEPEARCRAGGRRAGRAGRRRRADHVRRQRTGLDLPTALVAAGRRLADFDVYWFEEPVNQRRTSRRTARLARALAEADRGG